MKQWFPTEHINEAQHPSSDYKLIWWFNRESFYFHYKGSDAHCSSVCIRGGFIPIFLFFFCFKDLWAQYKTWSHSVHMISIVRPIKWWILKPHNPINIAQYCEDWCQFLSYLNLGWGGGGTSGKRRKYVQ